MFPAQTDYYRPASVSEAVDLLSSNEGAKVLAGGHSLIPLMKLRLVAPPVLVDIGRIEALKGISTAKERWPVHRGPDDPIYYIGQRLGEGVRPLAGGSIRHGRRPGRP